MAAGSNFQTGRQSASGGGGGVSSVTATSPLASSGGANPDISLNSAVPINKGGTGQTTANPAFNALAPSQTGNNGKSLQTNGTNASWETVTGTPETLGEVLLNGNDGAGIQAKNLGAGTDPDDAVVVGQLDTRVPYLSYAGSVTQALTAAPVPIFENTNFLNGGVNFTWTRIVAGVYQITADQPVFDATNTICFFNSGAALGTGGNGVSIIWQVATTTVIQVETFDIGNGSVSDNCLTKGAFDIRTYF